MTSGETMPTTKGHAPIRAAIFDMDGVVTDTAKAHFEAWKETFDAALSRHASGEAARPFTRGDYRAHVDGVPRLDGVRGLLAARGVTLPEGGPGEEGLDTVLGIAAAKNRRFRSWLARTPVPAYEDTIALIRALKARGIAVGVFSASRNAAAVLDSAGVRALFDAEVDGAVARAAGLRGKPAPDVLVETARRLGTAPDRTVVFEDAVAGVRAAVAGGFGLVVGVDRAQEEGSASRDAALRAAGADLVACDLRRMMAQIEGPLGASARHPGSPGAR